MLSKLAEPPIPHSFRADILWPALPRPDGARRLALLQQLEASQWWPPETLRTQQFRQVTALLGHAARTVPFYKDRLLAAGIEPGAPITEETWAGIPLLTREDIQDAGEALYSKALPPGHGRVQKIATSGSTGKPIVVQGTGMTQLFWDLFTLRDHIWHRRDLSAKLAVIRSLPGDAGQYPKGTSLRHWGRPVAAVYPSGPCVALSVTATIEQQAEWLLRERPDYLLTLPSNLMALARHCQDQGIAFPWLREVRTLSEVVTPRLRQICREVWGVSLSDIYSAQEVGYIALQCPEAEHYHVQAEGHLVEVLDQGGEPCGPGEVGRVVVTDLHNFASPLIRYVVGDYAELGGPCACGRGLPVLKRIAGRARNMLTLPTGGQVWPRLSEARYHEIEPLRQYQLVQTSLEKLEMRLVVTRPMTREEEDRLRGIVLERIGYPFPITFSYHDEIPRGPGGKYEDFKSEVTPK
ncbi:MAG: hypothetical protein V3T80_11440 [Kiloniellales bacterium]